jgi:hypothetical protein
VSAVLRVYLDGSWSDRSSMTLAAIAADEMLWEDFEGQWRFVLTDRGNAPYSHMQEAMALEGVFKGWDPKIRDLLVSGLGDLIAEFGHKPKFQVFTCTVDLEAHQRWKVVNRIPSPERLCTRIVFGRVLDWYGEFPDAILGAIEGFFDQNERFMTHLHGDWNNRQVRRRWPVWSLIRTIAAADMRFVLPLQAADMIAWARNRLASDRRTSRLAIKPQLSVYDHFSVVAKSILSGPAGWHLTVDEHMLATARDLGRAYRWSPQ